MSTRPILFSAPMVRALLDGTKTQTRRVVKVRGGFGFLGGRGQENDPECWGYAFDGPDHHGYGVLARGCAEHHDHGNVSIRCPYGDVGDTLWLKETMRVDWWDVDGLAGITFMADGLCETRRVLVDDLDVWVEKQCNRMERAGGRAVDPGDGGDPVIQMPEGKATPQTPSIFMPRWASRISLRITDVRVQRLQDISEEDALAEGVRRVTKDGSVFKFCVYDAGRDTSSTPWAEMPRTAVDAYAALWDVINGDGAWADNPWVWAISFERVTP